MNQSYVRVWPLAAMPLLACASWGVTGCASLPKTGVAANGEPLAVDVSSEQRTHVAKEKVGEVAHKDSSGKVIGTSEVYEDKVIQYNVTRWQVFQGNDKIDDESFFRIAGDRQAADEVAEKRQRGVTLNRVGYGMLALGIAAVATGFVLNSTLEAEPDASGVTTPVLWPWYVIAGGGALAGGGIGLVSYGNAAAAREHPVDDPVRAQRVANKYNASRARSEGP